MNTITLIAHGQGAGRIGSDQISYHHIAVGFDQDAMVVISGNHVVNLRVRIADPVVFGAKTDDNAVGSISTARDAIFGSDKITGNDIGICAEVFDDHARRCVVCIIENVISTLNCSVADSIASTSIFDMNTHFIVVHITTRHDIVITSVDVNAAGIIEEIGDSQIADFIV